MKTKIWMEEPEAHDFIAASEYLSLLYQEKLTQKVVNHLKNVKTISRKAKDILRASQLPLLPKNNIYIKDDLQKVKKGKKLSPILLVRDSKLIIADGYHRVCAIYYLSEDLEVPCRIVDVICPKE